MKMLILPEVQEGFRALPSKAEGPEGASLLEEKGLYSLCGEVKREIVFS